MGTKKHAKHGIRISSMITNAWNGYALNVLSMRYKSSCNIKNKLPQTMNELLMESMIVLK